MADYSALRAALDDPAYLGLTDSDAAAHFNAVTQAMRVPVISITAVLQWAGAGPLDTIDAGQSFAHPDAPTQRAVRAACKAAMRLFNGTTDNFDLDSPTNRQLLGLFVAVGIVTAPERDALLALGDRLAPLYSQPGQFGVPASAADVAHARSLV